MELAISLVPFDGRILACAKLGDAVVGSGDYDPVDGCFTHVWTHPQARRRGIAGAVYAEVRAQGHRVVPSETLTAAGMAFWRGRGVDPARHGSRLVVGGRWADDDVHGIHDVSAALEAWDAARADGPVPPGP